MSTAKFAEPILQTIDLLRSRKARPDLARICHMVQKRHGLNPEEVKNDLLILIAENVVVKDIFKGNISYRNVAKWRPRRRNNHNGEAVAGRKDVIRSNRTDKKLVKLKKAVKRLAGTKGKRGRPPLKSKTKERPPLVDVDAETEDETLDSSPIKADDESEAAVTSQLEETEVSKTENGSDKSDSEIVVTTSSTTTEESTSTSRTVKVGVGKHKTVIKYELVPAKLSDSESEGAYTENDGLKSEVNGFGSKKLKLVVSQKRKKIKKNLGPDFQSYPPVKRVRHGEGNDAKPSSSLATESDKESEVITCDFCLKTALSNPNGQPEPLLFCKDCQAKAHPSCMNYSEDLAARACRSPWQCSSCKTCHVCNDSGDGDAMLFCDACDKGYHMNCHNPPIKEKPTGIWVCCQCVLELGVDGEQNDDGNNNDTDQDLNLDDSLPAADGGGASCLPTPNESPVHLSEDAEDDNNKDCVHVNGDVAVLVPRLAGTLDLEVPDACEWTILDVVQFFSEIGFVEQAEAFKQQEIDGKALLLMTRMDVLTGLSIKLGPALKIFVHVQRLQTKHLNSH